MEIFKDFMSSLEESLHLKSIETKDSLEKQNKDYLIKKVLYLQEELKKNEGLANSIKGAIVEGFNVLTANSNEKTFSNNSMTLATSAYVDKGFYNINESVSMLKTDFNDFKQKIKRIDEYNKKVEDFNKINFVYDLKENIPTYNIYEDVEEDVLQSFEDKMKKAYNNQYYYNKGYNDCLRSCKYLSRKELKKQSLRDMYKNKVKYNEKI